MARKGLAWSLSLTDHPALKDGAKLFKTSKGAFRRSLDQSLKERSVFAFALTLALTSCTAESVTHTPPEEWVPGGPTRTVTLPDGAEIEAVLRVTDYERTTGMMFRHHLPPDKGMLFIFSEMSLYSFWMYNTVIPLDIVWMDGGKRIVEIYENAPPCGSRDARDCPGFGGNQPSVYVLELAAGQVAIRGLELGDELKF